MTRYQHLANILAERIEQGLYRSGERLPSVRALSQEHGVSISNHTARLIRSSKIFISLPRSHVPVFVLSARPSHPFRR